MMTHLLPFDVWHRSTWCNQEVAGEYYYSKAWRPFFLRKLPTQGVELMEQAVLVREPKNRHDRNAVRVEIRGLQVGHLPAEDAERYRSILDHLAAQGFAVRMHARIWAAPEIEYQYDRRGEMREVDTGKVNCRVTLALPEPHLLIPLNPPPAGPHTMLPMGGSVMVKTDGVPMAVFEPVLTDSGEGWVHATLHEAHEQLARSVRELVEVRINGSRAGRMTPAMSKKFLPVVRALTERGRICVTPAIVRGNRLHAEVRVHGAQASNLPQDWLLEHANHALTNQSAAAAAPANPVTVTTPAPAERPIQRSASTESSRSIGAAEPPGPPPDSATPVAGQSGWFPDPQGVAPFRFWDGTSWTSRIRMR